jgi:hypothetical protein
LRASPNWSRSMVVLLSAIVPETSKGLTGGGQALRVIGGASRDRTGDLYNAIVALSQLSYDPGKGGEFDATGGTLITPRSDVNAPLPRRRSR